MEWETWIKALIWIICLFPIWGTFLWTHREGSVRPRIIPKEQIFAKAEELQAKYGDETFEHVCINEHRGWYDGNMFEQGHGVASAKKLCAGIKNVVSKIH